MTDRATTRERAERDSDRDREKPHNIHQAHNNSVAGTHAELVWSQPQ